MPLTGKYPRFYFAWVAPNVSFSAGTHAVEDEKILAFTMTHTEGDFCNLEIVLKNPRIGLLNTGRKVWAFLSVDFGGGPDALFYGRLIGIPNSINREKMTLQFIARPGDFKDRKATLAETLRVAPWWEPIYIAEDKELDDDVVLEARTEEWHIDRVTHEVTVSDLIDGDSNIVFQEPDCTYDDVEMEIMESPIRAVKITADAPWSQFARGSMVILSGHHEETKAGEGLISSWPKAGASLGGGWEVLTASATSPQADLTDDDIINGYNNSPEFNPIPPPYGTPPNFPAGFLSPIFITGFSTTTSETSTSVSRTSMGVVNYDVYLSLVASYETDRQRKDTVEFTLEADFQPVVTLADETEVLEIKVSGRDVGTTIHGSTPVGDVKRRSFITQDRGQDAIKYLLLLARANIVQKSRAVQIKFKTRLEDGVPVTLRHNVTLFDDRLPGGEAVGKVIEYEYRMEGGNLSATITMACAIGYGGSLPTRAPSNVYAADGVLAAGIQAVIDELLEVTDDLAYVRPIDNPQDDGIVFPIRRNTAFVTEPIWSTQETVPFSDGIPTVTSDVSYDDCGNTTSVSVNMSLDTGPISEWLAGIKTTCTLELKDLTKGPFTSPYVLEVEKLILPKMIDLEAASI